MTFPQSATEITHGGITAQSLTDTLVANTVVETVIASLPTPTGFLEPGDHLLLRIAGELLNNTGSAATFLFNLKLDGTTILATPAVSIVQGTTSRRWVMVIDVAMSTLVSEIVSATFQVSNTGSNFGYSSGANIFGGAGGNVASADFSSSKLITLTVTMGTADAAITTTRHVALVEYMPAA